MLAEERMRLLSKVEEAWDDAVDGLVDGTLMWLVHINMMMMEYDGCVLGKWLIDLDWGHMCPNSGAHVLYLFLVEPIVSKGFSKGPN